MNIVKVLFNRCNHFGQRLFGYTCARASIADLYCWTRPPFLTRFTPMHSHAVLRTFFKRTDNNPTQDRSL